MIERDNFIRQTNNLIGKFKDSKSPIKEYLKTVCIYSEKIDTLKTKNIHELKTELDRIQMFIEIICFHVNIGLETFISFTPLGSFIIALSDDFMEYFLMHKNETKELIKWDMICELQDKYNQAKLETLVSGNLCDFNIEIGKDLKLIDLWEN
jgi:hypothetical protein